MRPALFVAAISALALLGVARAEDQASRRNAIEPVVQSPGQAPSVSPPGETPTDIALPTKDLFDVIRELFHKPEPPPPDYKKIMIAGSPVVSYSPTSGASLGFAGNVAFYRGHPQTTRISSVVASVTATTKAQLLASFKMNASSLENRWHIEADNRFFWTSQPTYGLGSDSQEDAKLDMKFNHFRIIDKYYHKVLPNIFLGAGYVFNIHNNIRRPDEVDPDDYDNSPFITYSKEFGFDLDSQTSSGLTALALLDSRDGAINPTRGWYVSAAYTTLFEDFLGGSSSWQQLSYDFRTYARLSRNARHMLAFWTYGDLVTGGVAPYLDLPSTGGDTYSRSGRGYPQGRFRGQRMLYAEAEYRWTMTDNGLFGMVAFLNTETLSNEQEDEKLFDSFATGAGLGFRFMLNKQSRSNLCFDIGFGRDGSKGVYFGVQEAF